ncbi:hypothetical protein FHG87_009821 [Trinorchestia longiramus]|nr:hypothetical protein FHG87_009821 [Trinorchestia longiramus]
MSVSYPEGSFFGAAPAAAVHSLGHGALGLIYSSSFLYAGFIGLGALWLASYVGHGGYTGVIGSDYDYYDYGGYGDSGGYGGYQNDGYGGGYNRRTRGPSQARHPARTGHKKSHWKDRRKSEWLRKKRSADEFFDREVNYEYYDNFDNSDRLKVQNQEEQMIEHLKRSDTGNCGMRLVCELSGIQHRSLTKEEWDILQFIRSGDVRFNMVRPGQGVSSSSVVLRDYKDAADFGAKRGNCRKKYRKCRYSASEMMTLIRVLKK